VKSDEPEVTRAELLELLQASFTRHPDFAVFVENPNAKENFNDTPFAPKARKVRHVKYD
jgi:hypothetical protein